MLRINPLWWPLLTALSPLLVPVVMKKNRKYRENLKKVSDANSKRISEASLLDLPELEYIDLTVLVEEKTEEGFLGSPGVSYLLETDRGSLLFDVGFGPDHKTLAHNAEKLGITLDKVDECVISHLHPDHMGGTGAVRAREVRLPEELGSPGGMPCWLPDQCGAPGFDPAVVERPMIFKNGMGTTGPLGRSLFFFGLTEELALVARVKGKGLVVFTGCGHPTIEVIMDMVKKLSGEPVHAIGGGLHFPVTRGRGKYAGIQMQMLIGTGLPPWKKISDDNLTGTIDAINGAAPKSVFLSAHDTCDHSLDRLDRELDADTVVLRAGGKYRI